VLKRRYVKVLMDLIADLQDREGGQSIDLRVATFSLFGMMNWIYTWYQPKRDLSLPELMEQMLRVYFLGILEAGKAQAPWITSSAAASDEVGFSLWPSAAVPPK
jgi:hypothetical protein